MLNPMPRWATSYHVVLQWWSSAPLVRHPVVIMHLFSRQHSLFLPEINVEGASLSAGFDGGAVSGAVHGRRLLQGQRPQLPPQRDWWSAVLKENTNVSLLHTTLRMQRIFTGAWTTGGGRGCTAVTTAGAVG